MPIQLKSNQTNSITLKPGVSSIDVSDKIEEALKRNAEVDARRISVQAWESYVKGKINNHRGT